MTYGRPVPDADPLSRRTRLRLAEAADATAVAGVLISARRDAEARGLIPAAVHREPEIRAWVRDVVLAEREVVVAEVLDADVGVGGDHRIPRGDAAHAAWHVCAVLVLDRSWVDQLYVLPAAQGRGVGGRLLSHAKSRRPDGLGLWVFQSNVLAIDFYTQHGFVIAESTDGAGNEEREPDHRMMWRGTQPAVASRHGGA